VIVIVVIVVVAFLMMGRDESERTTVTPPTAASTQQPASVPPTDAPARPRPTPVPPTDAPAQQQPTPVPPETSAPGDLIAFADLDWNSALIQTRIAQYIVEHGYGYPTNAVPGGTNRLFQSLRDGNIHVSMEIWLPLQADDWSNARANGEVEYIGVSMDKDWQSTFVIPTYLQEEYPGLDHVDDLKDPRYRELFATASSDGKARLFACAVGWACQEINDAQIDGYELTGHLQVVRPDSEQALFEGLYRAYAKREPWLGYMWGTAAPAILLDLVRLEERPYSDECWFTSKACAFEDTTILIAVHSGLPSFTPEIYDFLTKWNFTTADYNGVLQWMEDNGATVEQAALNWLKEEGDSWMPWVTEKARAGVQAALTEGVDAKGWPGK
jgi:glycine betaine/proline transport system substrate-binding protein